MVEAIETSFIPVLIYNNKKEDADILKKFEEPSWNNPVVRYLDAKGKDIIKRRDRVWSTLDTAARMVQTLKTAKLRVPEYLALTAGQPAKTETAIFAMHCYWEGEAKLGKLTGVYDTKSSWLQGKEVVEVQFDPGVLNYKKLAASALEMKCASTIFTTTDAQQKIAAKIDTPSIRVKPKEKTRVAKLSDQKYYLRNHRVLSKLPLTKLQSTKVNAHLGSRQTGIPDCISPRQLKMAKRITKVLLKDPKALGEFVMPENDAKLVSYQAKLVKKLDALEKGK